MAAVFMWLMPPSLHCQRGVKTRVSESKSWVKDVPLRWLAWRPGDTNVQVRSYRKKLLAHGVNVLEEPRVCASLRDYASEPNERLNLHENGASDASEALISSRSKANRGNLAYKTILCEGEGDFTRTHPDPPSDQCD